MTATIAPTTADRTVPAYRAALATRPLWLVGLVATVAGTAVTTLVAALARAADIPLAVASSSDEAAEVIPLSGVAVIVAACGLIGVLIALATNRWAKRPARTFVVVTTVLTVVSFTSPVIAENATTATRLVLELCHVVAALVIIPPIAYRLAQRAPRP